MKYEDLIEKFILNCDNFWEEEFILDIDSKHKNILKTFNEIYKNNINLFAKNLINWEGQTDLGAPWQIKKYHIKKFGFTLLFLNTLKEIKRFINGTNFDKKFF